MAKQFKERRRYLRVETPLKIRVIHKDKIIAETTTKNISPLGLRFETSDKSLKIDDPLEVQIEIPKALNPVHAKAAVIWKNKPSTENGSLYDVGCGFTKIEEDNKNTFLKFFCDLLYEQAKEIDKKGDK
ncbi:MAG: PilZ domain-containing protein [Candidatus Omnitrophica bacterium]|nr:PilZ domain-containing protein [Candidatus Omnitrophota bacterium]